MLDFRMGFLILSWMLAQAVHALPGDRVGTCPAGQRVDGEYLIRYQEAVASARAAVGGPVNKIDADRVIFRAPAKASSGTASGAAARAALMSAPTLSLVQKRSAGDMQELAIRDDVLSIEENCRVKMAATTATPNDPLYSRQWAHTIMDSPTAWASVTGKRSVIVAVIDSGMDLNHPDLKNNLWTNVKERDGQSGVDDDGNGFIDDIHGYNFPDGTGDPDPGTGIIDDHGTHVAGIIGAQGNNAVGIAGMAWQTSLMAIRVFPASGDATVADILSAIYYAVDNGARVLNLSIGVLSSPLPASLQAFDYAISNDVLPVVAAGNNGVDASKSWPANVPGVLAVGALDGSMALANFSNSGSLVRIIAPGTGIYSTLPGGNYDYMSGTSMAAPFVAGAAALALSLNPALTQTQLQNLMVQSAKTLSTASYPVLNPGGLAAAVLQTLPKPSPTPTPTPTPTPKPTPAPVASPSAQPQPQPQPPEPQPSASPTPAVPTPLPSPSASLTPADGSLINSGLSGGGGGAQTPGAQMAGCGRVVASVGRGGSGGSGFPPASTAGLVLMAVPLMLLGLLHRRGRALQPMLNA